MMGVAVLSTNETVRRYTEHQSRLVYLLLIPVHDLVSTVKRRAGSLGEPDAVHNSGVGDADDTQRQEVLHHDQVDDVQLTCVCAPEHRKYRLTERLEGRHGSFGGGRRQEGVVDDPDHPEGEHCRQAGQHADCPDDGDDEGCRPAGPAQLEWSNDGVVTIHRDDGQRENAHIHAQFLDERRHGTKDLGQVPRPPLTPRVSPAVDAESRAGPSAGGVPPGTGTGC